MGSAGFKLLMGLGWFSKKSVTHELPPLFSAASAILPYKHAVLHSVLP